MVFDKKAKVIEIRQNGEHLEAVSTFDPHAHNADNLTDALVLKCVVAPRTRATLAGRVQNGRITPLKRVDHQKY